MTYKPPYTVTSNIVNLVAEISDQVARIEVRELSAISPRLRKIARIQTLVGTLEIEGNTLGEEKVTALINGKRVLGTALEVSEVEGAIRAYQELPSYQPDECSELLRAHALMMNGILTHPGAFRTTQVGVGSHVAPPAHRVPTLMNELFAWLRESEDHPLIKSSVFHYEFEFIHPFTDGNGRLGRLWQTAILQHWRSAFSLTPTESLIRDQQQEYYKALEQATQNGESSCFIEFMLETILYAIRSSVKSTVKGSVKTDAQILAYFRKNPTGTVAVIAKQLGLSTRAIEKHIAALKKENRLIRTGSPRSGFWEVRDVCGKDSICGEKDDGH